MNSRIEEIYHFLSLTETLATAGQPTAEQMQAVHEAGFEVVINLLPQSELLPNERELVAALGMEYVHIPVVWTAPAPEDFSQFVAAMEAQGGKRVFVHCAANMRVSAFLYLYRTLHEGVPEAAARADMNCIWEPNDIWQAFLARIEAAGNAKA